MSDASTWGAGAADASAAASRLATNDGPLGRQRPFFSTLHEAAAGGVAVVFGKRDDHSAGGFLNPMVRQDGER
jgi:hypothetical protein